ncbi:MAG: sugar transferase [Deltaproteobacteria bacterium]|nr:sugar transferase [Deltaproteobacteria bacterium]
MNGDSRDLTLTAEKQNPPLSPFSKWESDTAVGAISYDTASAGGSEYPFKRSFDFVLATLALIVSVPLWAIFALAIKLEDGGPVLFRQKRWGKDKKPIQVYKFRTMVADADKKFGGVQASEDDPRITRVGRFLRATSLDELPQILNIWRGEMSWVGPRVLPINEVQIREENGFLPDEATPGFDLRCTVRPGLTGMAQIYAPRDVPRADKFRYDLLYIQNQNLWLDLRLIAMSFWITFRGKWESRERKI